MGVGLLEPAIGPRVRRVVWCRLVAEQASCLGMGRLEGWVVKLCCWKRWCRRSCPNSMADHFGFLFSMKGVAEGEKVLNGTNGGLGRVIVHHR